MIKDSVRDAINAQMNREFYSSTLYLAMAAYFESMNLKGFSAWMQVQAKEELAHGMKFYHYLVEQGARISLAAIEAPRGESAGPGPSLGLRGGLHPGERGAAHLLGRFEGAVHPGAEPALGGAVQLDQREGREDRGRQERERQQRGDQTDAEAHGAALTRGPAQAPSPRPASCPQAAQISPPCVWRTVTAGERG